MQIPLPRKAFKSIVLLALLSVITLGQSRSVNTLPPYQLAEMRIVPYSQRTNTFLAEVKNDKGAEFWNELNLSLFVTIQVSGQAGSYSSNRQVEFTAYEGGS